LKFILAIIAAIVVGAPATAGVGREPYPSTFNAALELIHAYSGAGSELERAQKMIDKLAQSRPLSGYAEALTAEMLSTWKLDTDGPQGAIRLRVLALADKALRRDSKLTLAYVARARAQLRASRLVEAQTDIDAALALDPGSDGATFLRAELLSRRGQYEEASGWFEKFIDLVPSNARKSNGHLALGRMYVDQLHRERPDDESALIAKARANYQRGVDLDPQGAWKNVNLAIFLNNYAEDFVAAERYALNALAIMNFPMARMQLAMARYQQLFGREKFGDVEGFTLANTTPQALKLRVSDVENSTGVSLQDAAEFEPRTRVGHRLASMLEFVR